MLCECHLFLLMIKASLKFSIISTGVLSQFTLILYGTGSSATDPSISDYTPAFKQQLQNLWHTADLHR